MNVSSSQTLILAGEPLPARYDGSSASSRRNGAAADPAAGSARHVTVIAAHAGSTVVVVNGDYAPAATTSRSSIAPAAPRGDTVAAAAGQPTGATRDVYGNPGERRANSTPSSFLQPAEQYARTQRNLEPASHRSQLDVHV